MHGIRDRNLIIVFFLFFAVVLVSQGGVAAQEQKKGMFEVVRVNSTDSLYHQIYLRSDSLLYKVISKKENIHCKGKKQKIKVGKVYYLELVTALRYYGMVIPPDQVAKFEGIELEDSCVHNLYQVKKMSGLYITME